MNAITTTERGALALTESELLDVMEASLFPGANRQSIKLVLGYCTARSLDPMLKPAHIVPMRCKKANSRDYEWRDTVMPAIGLYRIQAARTGQHAGTDEPIYGPMVDLKVGDVVMQYPEWCRVTVYRMVGGQRCAFTATEYWTENYATAANDTNMPNAMWKKRVRAQISKCAEAQALRKGFPEVGNQPTADEMEGKTGFDFDLQPNGDMKAATEAAAATPAPTPTVVAALQPYPQERFDANLPEWAAVIQSRRHTADRMIAMLSTKGGLSEPQVNALRDLEVIENPIDGEPAAAATQEPQQ